MVRVWHPDRFHGDEDLISKANGKTAQINEAFSFLGNYKDKHPRPSPSTTTANEASPRSQAHVNKNPKAQPAASATSWWVSAQSSWKLWLVIIILAFSIVGELSKSSHKTVKSAPKYRLNKEIQTMIRPDASPADSTSQLLKGLTEHSTPNNSSTSARTDQPAGVTSTADAAKEVASSLGEGDQASTAPATIGTTDVSPFTGWQPHLIKDITYVPVSNIASFYKFKSMTLSAETFNIQASKIRLSNQTTTVLLLNGVKLHLIHSIVQENGVHYVSKDDVALIIDPLLRPQEIDSPALMDKVFVVIVSRTHEMKQYFTSLITGLRSTMEASGRKLAIVAHIQADGNEWQEKIPNLTSNGLTLIIEESIADSSSGGQRVVCMRKSKIDVAIAFAIHARTILQSRVADAGVSINSSDDDLIHPVVWIQIDMQSVVRERARGPDSLSASALNYGHSLGEGLNTATKAIFTKRH
jgi:hypothetical protein